MRQHDEVSGPPEPCDRPMSRIVSRNVSRRAEIGFFTVVFALAFSAAARADGVFHRGVAIHDAMNWATMAPGNTHYVFPPFSDAQHPLTPDELAIIRHAGFDFVRLTVDPGPFLQFQGARRDAAYGILRQRVQTILAADLSAIVDFHPVGQDADYGPKAIVQGADTPLFAAYCDMLARVARVLDGLHTNRVALELMNEPSIGGTADTNAAWQAMEENAYRGVRAASPHLGIVVAGGLAGAYTGLLKLDPSPFASDPNTIFTFHYYLPFEFTHQSLANVPAVRTAADIPYPALARPLRDSVDALRARLDKSNTSAVQKAADTALGVACLIRYRASNFSRADIHSAFDQVAAWATDHRIPRSRIFLGEFGVVRTYGRYQGARNSERVRWLGDVREEAEAHGFFWSIWAYRGKGGMAIIKNDTTDEIDPVTLRALKLPREDDLSTQHS
jgi:endoglucanase